MRATSGALYKYMSVVKTASEGCVTDENEPDFSCDWVPPATAEEILARTGEAVEAH